MMFDPQVSASVNTLKTGILADGVSVTPAVTDKSDAAHARAQEIADFVADCLDDLDPSIDQTLWTLFDALAYGSKVAEQVYALDGGQLRLVSLKVKERRTTAFVVDAYLNIVGIIGLMPGQPMPIVSSLLIDRPEEQPNLLPREKFAILSYWPRDSDPRGTSILRAAYRPWWDKQQTIPEYLKYLAQFAGPSIIATAPERRAALPPLGRRRQPDGGRHAPQRSSSRSPTNWPTSATAPTSSSPSAPPRSRCRWRARGRRSCTPSTASTGRSRSPSCTRRSPPARRSTPRGRRRPSTRT
jgi:hypothetical protein